MPSIRTNAYRILGLDGNAGQRDIMKRYREISNRLKIDDCPQYAMDMNLPNSFRTEDYVNEALKKLQNHKSGLLECFFWFSISDSVDEEAFSLLGYGDAASCGRAIQIWKEHSQIMNSTGLSYKRNLAILYCLILFNEENDAMLKESVSAWKDIVDSDRFWTSFVKKYEMINDREVHTGVITELKKSATASISDIYYDLHEHHDDEKYVKKFHDVFGTFGPKTEKKILKPICQSIYCTIEKLKDVGDGDGSLGDGGRKIAQMEKVIEQLEYYIKQLHDLGLYDSDQVMIMRDHAGEAIGRAATVVHNEMHMREKSVELFNLALNMSVTASLKERIEYSTKTVTDNIARDEENKLVIESGFSHKKYLVVKEDFIEYGTAKIYYKNADTIIYYGTGSDSMFKITSNHVHISIKIGDGSVFNKLMDRVWPLVVPHLIDRLVKRIFEKKESVRIGDVRFDQRGYHRSRTFRTDESVLWHSDTIYSPSVADNKITLYKNAKNKPKLFTVVPMWEPNAVIIPTLIKVCQRESYNRNQMWP